MEQINKFANWYTKITEAISTPKTKNVKSHDTNEDNAAITTDVATPAETSKADMLGDVDSIMNGLSQLSVQIKENTSLVDVFENEEVEILEEDTINELTAGDAAGGLAKAGSKLADWLFYAPKYRNMQKKINKMKINELDIQLAIDNLPRSAENQQKIDLLRNKKTTLSQQITDLQSAVNDKSNERGEYIQKVLSSEKIKGKMELVKRASGQEDDPKKKKTLADSMRELQSRFEEEQKAIKQLQDKEKQEAKTDTGNNGGKEDIIDAEIKQMDAEIENQLASIERDKIALKNEEDPDSIAKLKNSINKSDQDVKELRNKIKNLKDKLSKMTPKESLYNSAIELNLNELATEISSKQDWQFENNSALYVKYNSEILKNRSNNKLNESRYTNMSIADKFKTLLG